MSYNIAICHVSLWIWVEILLMEKSAIKALVTTTHALPQDELPTILDLTKGFNWELILREISLFWIWSLETYKLQNC